MTHYDYLSLNEFKERELEILELMAEGLSNAEIADKLYVTKETVRWYNKQIYSKLGTSRRTEAISLAQKAGLIDSHDSAVMVATPSDNLPLLSTPFVGRKKDIAELTALLAQPQSRLMTIVGPGGMGKTRLAIEVAKGQVNAFSSGVRYVALASVDPADFTGSINPVVAMLADALGHPLREGSPPEDQLLAYLQNKEMLIVFDNFEHLVKHADFLSNLLSQAPQIKVLVTSRERLNLREEWLFTLAGMAIPTDKNIKTSELSETSKALAGYDAIQLFWQRARQGQPDFDLSVQQTEVIRICQLVEGLPLGIELAATWVRQMPCRAIVWEIEKNIDFLATNLRNVPERQRSLRAVFDHSWQLLPEAERLIMQKLSLFRGGFQPEAAEAIAGAGLFQLSTLVDKSLLQVTPVGRYNIHEGLRQYAAEKLEQSPDIQEAVHEQHGLFFLNLVSEQESQLKGAGIKEAQQVLTADIDNIRMAWRWIVEQNRYAEIKRALLSLWIYYEIQGWYLEGDRAFGRAVAKLRPQCKNRESTQISADNQPSETCILLAQVQAYQAYFQVRLGRLKQAEANLQESLSMLQSGGRSTWRETALSLAFFGMLRLFSREYTQVITLNRESKALFDKVGDSWGRGLALSPWCMAAFAQGQYANAEQLSQESVTSFNDIGERRFVTFPMNNLGRVAQARGQYERAEAIYREVFEIRTALDDRTGVAFVLYDLGEVVRLQSKPDQAQQYYQQSMALAKEIGLQLAAARALWGLGSLAEGLGDYAAAKQFFQESLALNEGGNPSEYALAGPGWAALGLGEYQEAEHYFKETLKQAAQAQHILLMLDVVTGLAHLLARSQNDERAVALLALVLNHPATYQETKDRATNLYTELATELSPEKATLAYERGKARELAAVVDEVLDGNP